MNKILELFRKKESNIDDIEYHIDCITTKLFKEWTTEWNKKWKERNAL
jgi:hypothetical protein